MNLTNIRNINYRTHDRYTRFNSKNYPIVYLTIKLYVRFNTFDEYRLWVDRLMEAE